MQSTQHTTARKFVKTIPIGTGTIALLAQTDENVRITKARAIKANAY